MKVFLAIKALYKAIQRIGGNPKGIILHTDQGSQFTSLDFIKHCHELGISQSMSHAGCPYDNAPMERYYNTLKSEMIYQYVFETVDDLDYAISEYAYNCVFPFRHSAYQPCSDW